MPLSPSVRLGPYEIVAPIGKGGMGEVYKALDTRLDRTIAVKISTEQFSERFAREARASHSKGPCGWNRRFDMRARSATRWTRPRKGIIHRDLKPAG